MKKAITLVFSLIAIISVSIAQVKNPVKWVFTAKKINTGLYEVHLTATVDMGWHIYSQATPAGGPIPTSIKFIKNPLITIVGATKEEGKLEEHHEPLFGVSVRQYSDKVDFIQQVKVKGKVQTSLTGSVEFITCNDRECLPPKTQDFSVSLK
jgi:DsbC/DsbD-like thiol-disulfide interchange protein